jgi:hypothetical protein
MVDNFPHIALKDFLKLNLAERSNTLRENGTLLDTDTENGESVQLYFMKDFFAEEVSELGTRQLKEVIPYRCGYKLTWLQELNKTPRG